MPWLPFPEISLSFMDLRAPAPWLFAYLFTSSARRFVTGIFGIRQTSDMSGCSARLARAGVVVQGGEPEYSADQLPSVAANSFKTLNLAFPTVEKVDLGAFDHHLAASAKVIGDVARPRIGRGRESQLEHAGRDGQRIWA